MQSSARINGDEEEQEQGNNLPATQPKWYQFIKRFKNWVNRRRTERESMEQEPEEENSNPSTTSSKASDKKTSFRDSMKYEVIRDYKNNLKKIYYVMLANKIGQLKKVLKKVMIIKDNKNKRYLDNLDIFYFYAIFKSIIALSANFEYFNFLSFIFQKVLVKFQSLHSLVENCHLLLIYICLTLLSL